MRRILRYAVLLLLLLAMAFATAGWYVNQQLKQANIELLSWEIKQFSLHSIQLKTLSFIYHSSLRNPQKITLDNLTLNWSEFKQWWHEDYFQLSQLDIETLTIQSLKESLSKPSASKTSSPILWPTNREEWLSNKELISRFAWLHLIPKQIHINQFLLIQPCPAGSCSLSGNLNTTIRHPNNETENSQDHTDSKPLIQLSSQLHSTDHPDNILSINSQFYFNPKTISLSSHSMEIPEGHLPKLEAELSLQNLKLDSPLPNPSITLTLQSAITTDSQLTTKLKLQGLPPKASWFSSLSNWTRFSLPETAVQRLQQQAETPIELELEHQLALRSLGQLLNQTDNDLATFKSQLTTQLTAKMTLPQAVAIPNTGLVKGSLNTQVSVQNGLIKTYQLNSSGRLSALQHSPLLNPIHRTGLKLDTVDFQISSQPQTNSTNPLQQPVLATDATRFITQHLPIQIALQSAPLKKSSTDATQFKLTADGSIEHFYEFHDEPSDNPNDKLKNHLNDTLKVIIKTGHLSIQQKNLNLDSLFAKKTPKNLQKSNQYKLSNLKLDLPFQAEYSHRNLQISSTQASLKGDFKDLKNTLKLTQSQLDLTRLKAQITHNLNKPIMWSTTSQKAQLKTQVNSPHFQVSNLHSQLKNLSLKNSFIPNHKKESIEQIEIEALYNLNAKQIKQTYLRPQSWTANGRLSGNLNHLSMSGSIENESELTIQHSSQYQPKQFHSEWHIKPLFLLAGNPLEKTITKWPSQLVLANGQLALNGQFLLNTALLSKDKIAALSGKTQLSLKQISGLYQNTTLNQVSSEIEISLKKKQLKMTTPNFEVAQINHGVIAGPITLSAEYQTSTDHPFSGLLTLNHFQTELFNGRAWLSKQTIDLSKPFKTQLFLKNIDVTELLKQYPSQDFSGTGQFEGKLPFNIDLTGEQFLINLENGQLTSQNHGGLLQYKPAGKSGMFQTHQSMKVVLDVLEDFHYSLLESRVSISKDKKLLLSLTLQGNNPKFQAGRTVNLTIQLEEDLPALITSMQITNQVSETIKKRIKEKLEKSFK